MNGTRTKLRWLSAALALILSATTGWFVLRHRGSHDDTNIVSSSSGGPRPFGARSLPSLANGDMGSSAPATASPPYSADPIGARVEPLMNSWRNAIINRDADTVLSLDAAFASHAREFIPALMVSAEHDPDERVRSFSTRVLGKLRPPESVDLMRKLLADRSEYVRFNAAWALGELDDRAAAARLRHLRQRDPSPSVRQSAEQSLRRLEGS